MVQQLLFLVFTAVDCLDIVARRRPTVWRLKLATLPITNVRNMLRVYAPYVTLVRSRGNMCRRPLHKSPLSKVDVPLHPPRPWPYIPSPGRGLNLDRKIDAARVHLRVCG